jgi:hypothetical protein
MNPLILSVFAIVLTYVVALAFWHIQMRSRILRTSVLVSVIIIACFAGFAIPAKDKILRLITAGLGLLVAIRVYSYSQAGRTNASFTDYIRFLSIGLLSPHLLYSPARYTTKASPVREIPRVAIALAVIPVTWAAAKYLVLTEAGRNSWILNHLIVVVAFVIIFQSVGQCCLGVWRMLGLRSKPLVDNVVFALTPAEFWRRWSWPIHTWLFRHVFIPVGGRHYFFRATLAVFLASALMHEVMAFVGLGRMTGHWTLCFLLATLGVLASPVLESFARRGIAAQIVTRIITMVLLVITAIPAFVGINYFVRLYHKDIWLMW